MKKNLPILLFILVLSASLSAQEESIRGMVKSNDDLPLIGATVMIDGTSKGTVTDVDGTFELSGLAPGEITVTVSYLGYENASQTINLKGRIENLDFSLLPTNVNIEGVVVTAQKRAQQLQDVPIAISVLSKRRLGKLATSNLDELSDFIPGLNIQVQSSQRPGYVIRGLTSDGNDPNTQPRVSVYYNNVPINRASGAVVEPYDLERIEVVKGPQGTLFGRGAQIGAVHFLPQKPKSTFEAGAKVSYGSYNYTNVTGYLNTPLSDAVALRIAGTVDRMDGFINNTFGGDLNGKNTAAGRASLRMLPSDRFSVNLMLDYQRDDGPGVAFVTKNLANTNGESGVFLDDASLDQGEDLETSKENTLASLTLDYDFSESTSLTSITSLRWHEAFERWDGDGSAARTLDFSEENEANQFYQEIRLNADIGNNFKGVIGASYFTEDVDREFLFRFDERSVATFFFLRDPAQIVNDQGEPFLFPAIPESVPGLGGAPLPEEHIESQFQNGVNSSVQTFIDGTLDISDKFSLTAGMRLVLDNISVREKNEFIQQPSVLGNLTRRAPNLFSPVLDFPETETNSTAVTGRFVAKYDFTPNFKTYASYARGRRPEAIEFRNDGTTEILESETVNSYEIGFKSTINNRATINLSSYFQDYSNFRTTAFIDIDSLTAGGTPEVFQSNAGEATAFGIELEFNAALTNRVSLFGNYNYIRARFSDEDSNGKVQEYADNMFRLTPDHAFSLGLDMNFDLSEGTGLFILPTFAYKSKHFFDDSNPVDADNPDDTELNTNQFQDAYGLLNLSAGINLKNSGLKFVLFGRNLLDEEYVIDAGNTGAAILGQATYVRGRPRMLGVRIEWSMNK